jgi:acetyl-CoA decarbonylase/synthase complex subunit gamma
MKLTGLQIQKLLPKTNCKECGSNTCLAFAMKLAAKKAELSQCPYVSDSAKAVLGAAAEPPIRTVELGSPDRPFRAGGETVIFRHEKTFVNQTGLGVAVDDTMHPAAIDARVRSVADYVLERVGEQLTLDAISVAFESGAVETYVATVARVAAAWSGALVLRTRDPAALRAAAELPALEGRRPLLASATAETLEDFAEVADACGAPLAVTAGTFDELVAMVETLRERELKDLFLELAADSLAEHYQNNTILRRGALRGEKTLGYPTLRYIDSGDPVDDSVEACLEISKYGGLTILPEFSTASVAPLLTLRQNIFTDPQKPIQVEPRIYPVGEPDRGSPIFVTTNFSLTYFIVSGEIENSGASAWLLVPECEGMSVLTAWAAGKFGGDRIGAFAKEVDLQAVTDNRTIIIPGYVAQISGELEEALPGWKVLVGPQEASDIESFVKKVLG